MITEENMIVSEKSNRVIKWIITGLLVCLILLLTVPLLIGAGFTYPAADDFIQEAGAKMQMLDKGPIKGALIAAWGYYTGWQGTYVSDFMYFMSRPFTRFGLNGFRAVMVCMSASFVIALLFMAGEVVEFAQSSAQAANDIHGKWNKKLFLAAVLFYAALGLPKTWIGKEIFYWYAALMAYLLGMICLFIAIGFFLKGVRSGNKKLWFVISMIAGFVASGNSLQIASFTCSWLLIALLVFFLSAESPRKSLKPIVFCPFFAAFGGALFNVAAPGNYVRSDSTMEAAYGLLDAVKDTFVYLMKETRTVWRDPVFITLVVVLFLACLFFRIEIVSGNRIKWWGAFLVTGGVVVSHYLCIFPVIFGYHGEGLYSHRTKYVAEFEIRFSVLFAAMYLAQFVAQEFERKEKWQRRLRIMSCICGLLIVVASFAVFHCSLRKFTSGYSWELIREISNGTVRQVFNMRKEVLDTLENAEKGSDVYIKMPALPDTRVTYPLGLSTDATVHDNRSIAYLFDLNSVAVEYGGE